MTASPFQSALREELRAAAIRDLRRRRTRRRSGFLASAVAALAAIFGAITVITVDPAAADVEVRIRDGLVEVRIVGEGTTPDEVREAMEDAGLRVVVDGPPVGPSLVGRFVLVQLDDPSAREVEYLDSDGYGFDGFVVPEGWSGRLLIRVGARADGDETYEVGSDAFAAGEPLDCAREGTMLRDLRTALDELNVTVRAPGLAPIPLTDQAPGQFADWYVVSASALSAADVLLLVQEEQPTPAAGDPC